MAKFVGVIVGAIEIGIGIATAQPWLIYSGAATVATSAAALLLAPKLKAGQAAATQVQLGEVSRRGIFGKGATAGSLVDAFNYGGKNGTDWTVLVLALADHRSESLVGFYANSTYSAFAGDGVVPDPSADVQFKGQLQVYWRDGSWDQDVPSILLDNCPTYPAGHPLAGQKTWTAADRGRGVAYVVVAYKADKSDAKHPVWSSGQPQFLWVMKGLLCYSTREDSSVGGSGAHRWDDPTTREWSENLIDCRYTWVRGLYAGDQVDDPSMLLLGRGLSDVEAPPANVFAPANLCDEAVALKGVLSSLSASASHGDHTITLSSVTGLAAGAVIQISQAGGFDETVTVASIAGDVVTLTGGIAYDHPALTVTSWAGSAGTSEARYRVGGVFGGDDAYIDTENDFVAACGGMLVEREGSVELIPGAAQPVVWNITDDDLIVGSTVTAEDFRSVTDELWCNTVAAKYVEPTQKWSDHSAPVRRLYADVIADGKPRVAQPSLALVTSGTQAQRVAEQGRKLGRLWLTRSLTLGPRFIGVEHGDWLSWSSNRYYRRGTDPGTPILLQVQSDSQDEKWQNTLSFREVALNVADWNASTDELADSAVAVSSAAPGYGTAPANGSWALTVGAGPTLQFAGAVDDDDATVVIFEYRLHVAGQADDAGWIAGEQQPVTATSAVVSGLVPGTSYDGAVSYLVAGAQSDRLILGPVTSGSVVASDATTLGGTYGATDIASILTRLHTLDGL